MSDESKFRNLYRLRVSIMKRVMKRIVKLISIMVGLRYYEGICVS
jgi:hypothetical protein